MSKTTDEEKYKKLLHHLTPRSLCWIMEDLFTPRELDSVLKKAGTKYEGKEFLSAAPGDIIEELAQDFFLDENTGRAVADIFSRKRLKEIGKFSKMDPPLIGEYINDSKKIFKENRVGKVLWAIMKDNREEVNKLSGDFIKKIEDLINERNNNKKEEKEDKPEKKQKVVNNKKKISHKVTNKVEDKNEKELRILKEENRAHKNTYKQITKTNKKFKKEIASLVKKNEELQKEKASLNQKLENEKKVRYEKDGDNRHLVREIKKYQETIKKAGIPRVGIFVDVQNIYYGAKKMGYKAKLNFHKLLKFLTWDREEKRHPQKAIAYIVQTPEINQHEFIKALENVGYEVKSKNLKRHSDGSAKGDWDLGIAMDIILCQEELDIVVLVSGDGDFIELIQFLKNKSDIPVEVAAFQHNVARDLKDIADNFHPIGEDLII